MVTGYLPDCYNAARQPGVPVVTRFDAVGVGVGRLFLLLLPLRHAMHDAVPPINRLQQLGATRSSAAPFRSFAAAAYAAPPRTIAYTACPYSILPPPCAAVAVERHANLADNLWRAGQASLHTYRATPRPGPTPAQDPTTGHGRVPARLPRPYPYLFLRRPGGRTCQRQQPAILHAAHRIHRSIAALRPFVTRYYCCTTAHTLRAHAARQPPPPPTPPLTVVGYIVHR